MPSVRNVGVDADLGQLRVSRMTGCFAAGTILNSKTARSKLIGGMGWGISLALYEHATLDKKPGRWVNNNLAEYHIPTNLDIGAVDAFWVDEQDFHINPLGAKGIGEIGITGAGAAERMPSTTSPGSAYATCLLLLTSCLYPDAVELLRWRLCWPSFSYFSEVNLGGAALHYVTWREFWRSD